MKYTLYKPNSKNTGAAFSFDISKGRNGEAVLFVSMIQQFGWNDQAKTGSFKENAKNPDKSSTIKLSAIEAGEFLSSFKTRIPYVAFHKRDNDTTIIRLTPWDKDRKVKDAGGEKTYQSPAFGISVSKNSAQQFKLPLEAGEAEVLAQLLQVFIQESFKVPQQQDPQQPKQNFQKKEYPKKSPQVDLSEDSEDDVPF